MLPGGTLNADTLRTEPRAITFIKDFFDNDKPVAAICHAPWLLVEARVVKGHRLTSWPSLKTDVRNAGGDWVDEEVVVDHQIVTRRKPDDIPAFNEEMIGLFAQHTQRDNARPTIGPTHGCTAAMYAAGRALRPRAFAPPGPRARPGPPHA